MDPTEDSLQSHLCLRLSASDVAVFVAANYLVQQRSKNASRDVRSALDVYLSGVDSDSAIDFGSVAYSHVVSTPL